MQEIKPTESSSPLPFTQHHAFIIGIDEYKNISPLQTAVNDARKLEEVLKDQQHFSVHTPLLNATGDEIRNLLQSTLKEAVKDNDRVVFYFAGHGIAEDGEKGPAGYIVPADADPNDVKTFIPMEDLQNVLKGLPCRHLLLILDCCFSGAFKWSSEFRAFGSLMPKRIYKERFDRFVQDTAWQVITSSAYDQKAMDVLRGNQQTGNRGGIKLEDNTIHSPFAAALFRGLAGDADTKVGQFGDGVITATELYSYVRDQIEPATIREGQSLRQTPGFFPLRNDNKGEFIFLHPRHPLNLPPTPDRSPFMGLEPFEETDKELFYGRESVVTALYEKATNNMLLVVSGVSGSGKSSVVKAGLLPVLRERGFHILPVVRPGSAPLAALEKALNGERLGEQKTVLLIDQFEEIVTRCTDSAERVQFVARLREMLDGTSSDVLKIIITVRADFELQFGEGELKQYWTSGQYIVPPFTVEDWKDAIVGPTLQEVLLFDPQDLVDDIIQDVVQSPGALPLLSHMLSEFYKTFLMSGRSDRALKKEDYDKVGGVVGALLKKADALYQGLETGAQNTMRKIVLRMVAVSLEGELTGKSVPADELIYADQEENLRVQAVIEKLIEARLVVKGKDHIEPAHNALVQRWKTLIDWVHTIGDDKILLNTKLNVAANDYALSNNRQFLWNDNPHLSVLQHELVNPRQWFNAKEINFIQQSVQRKKTLKRILRAITAGVMVALSALTVWALISRYQATQNFKKAKSNLLAIRSEELLKTDPTKALRVAQAAFEILEPRSPVSATQTLSEVFHSQDITPFYAACFPHAKYVNSAVFSPDGQKILTASEDGFAKLWDTRGNLIHAFDHGGYEVKAAAFSPNGKVLTVAASVVRLWEMNGEPVDSIDGSDLANFSTDDKRIVSRPEIDGRKDGQYRALIDRLKNENPEARLAPNKNRILVISHDETVKLCDGEGKSLKNSIASNVVSAEFSSDGKRFVLVSLVGDTLSVISFWDEQGNFLGDFKCKDWVTKAVFSPDDEQILTSAKEDRSAKLWDSSKKFVLRIPHHGVAVNSALFSPDGNQMLTASFDGIARLWDEQGNLLDSLKHDGAVTSVVFSLDGKRILTSAKDDTARLWIPTEGQIIKLPHRGEVKAAVFSPADGSRILTASEDSTARLWTTSGDIIHTFRHRSEVLAAVFSPDGQHILTVSSDSAVTLWGANGDVLRTFKHSADLTTAVFSPDGGQILTAATDSTARLWGVNGDLIRTFGHGDKVKIAAFSPDGRRILTASNVVKIWDRQGKLMYSLTHKFAVTSLAFSPDGKQILTASVDKTAKLWNVEGELLANYRKHERKVNSAFFSADGKKMITASDDGYARIWWTPEAIDVWLRNAPVYRLTPGEEDQYDIVK